MMSKPTHICKGLAAFSHGTQVVICFFLTNEKIELHPILPHQFDQLLGIKSRGLVRQERIQ